VDTRPYADWWTSYTRQQGDPLPGALRFHRRQLHVLQPAKGNLRKRYGGTLSMGFKRGSWVKHPKYGVCYVGGASNGRISLHTLDTGKRLCQNAKPEDLTFLCTASWRTRKGNAVSSAA